MFEKKLKNSIFNKFILMLYVFRIPLNSTWVNSESLELSLKEICSWNFCGMLEKVQCMKAFNF